MPWFYEYFIPLGYKNNKIEREIILRNDNVSHRVEFYFKIFFKRENARY